MGYLCAHLVLPRYSLIAIRCQAARSNSRDVSVAHAVTQTLCHEHFPSIGIHVLSGTSLLPARSQRQQNRRYYLGSQFDKFLPSAEGIS